MTTIAITNVDDHIADLLTEVINDFVKKTRDEQYQLNNISIGETKLVELEHIAENIDTELEDLDESETHELIDELDVDYVVSWIEERVKS